MAVVIRLQRIGKPKQAYYRVVAIDKTRGATGKPLEILGSYNPRGEKVSDKVKLNADRVSHWVKNGAKPSQTPPPRPQRAPKPKAEAAPEGEADATPAKAKSKTKNKTKKPAAKKPAKAAKKHATKSKKK